MAAPIADKIILPSDTGNTGKNVRTQTRVVGANTVHEHFMIPISVRKIDGIFRFVTALNSVQASAQNGTSTAFFWLENPAASTKRVRLRRLYLEFGLVTELDHITVPRIVLARFTFTGTASGASVTPAKRRSDDAANSANIRTASTGMTVSLGAMTWACAPPTLQVTTSGIASVWSRSEHEPDDEDTFTDLAPGEGLVLYQPDAGTASDGRRFVASGLWDEYDNT